MNSQITNQKNQNSETSNRKTPNPQLPKPNGFTLLEILIAMVILSIALTVAWQTFSTAMRAWTNGRAALDTMRHGDFILTQLTAALRSAAFFNSAPDKYGFRVENNPSGYGEHTISWVTSSDAFMPPNDPLASGLHRIEIGVGHDEDDQEGLMVSVWPYLADEEEIEKTSRFVTDTIKGLRFRAYDTKEYEEGWKDTWENSNTIPGLIEITLYADPPEKYNDPVEFKQIINIPLGIPVTNVISGAAE